VITHSQRQDLCSLFVSKQATDVHTRSIPCGSNHKTTVRDLATRPFCALATPKQESSKASQSDEKKNKTKVISLSYRHSQVTLAVREEEEEDEGEEVCDMMQVSTTSPRSVCNGPLLLLQQLRLLVVAVVGPVLWLGCLPVVMMNKKRRFQQQSCQRLRGSGEEEEEVLDDPAVKDSTKTLSWSSTDTTDTARSLFWPRRQRGGDPQDSKKKKKKKLLQVFVKGDAKQWFHLSISPMLTILQFKEQIRILGGPHPSEQSLLLDSKPLSDDKATLKHYNLISSGRTILLHSYRLLGGSPPRTSPTTNTGRQAEGEGPRPIMDHRRRGLSDDDDDNATVDDNTFLMDTGMFGDGQRCERTATSRRATKQRRSVTFAIPDDTPEPSVSFTERSSPRTLKRDNDEDGRRGQLATTGTHIPFGGTLYEDDSSDQTSNNDPDKETDAAGGGRDRSNYSEFHSRDIAGEEFELVSLCHATSTYCWQTQFSLSFYSLTRLLCSYSLAPLLDALLHRRMSPRPLP